MERVKTSDLRLGFPLSNLYHRDKLVSLFTDTYLKELSLALAIDFLLQTRPNHDHRYTECQRTTIHRFESLSTGKLHTEV